MTEHGDHQLLKETHDIVVKMNGTLFGMDGRNGVIGGIIEDLKDHDEALEDHHKRVRWIERVAWGCVGGVTVLAFLIGHHILNVAK